LLLSTEDTLSGAVCSRFYHCRTYNRDELKQVCAECGLRWERELWFSRLHRLMKLGGIIVELKRGAEASPGGAAVNSQGRSPWNAARPHPTPAPEGRQSTPRGVTPGGAPRFLPPA